ncbi:hypothetical protein PV327_003459 [Microctonus hyperodae]|uniref:Uncharacterized protein n=1 Tax=Microctonus hyperodae TaxID=165561 RepID=A0AA39G4C6_MICHY|nr:hypothetical protein PV327_003459 [Microctonus hyperodae]
MGLWKRFKPYLPSVLFPLISGSLIYADWRHTKLWKKRIAAEKEQLQEDFRMGRFRDKSALYGRELKPGEPPSWP